MRIISPVSFAAFLLHFCRYLSTFPSEWISVRRTFADIIYILFTSSNS